MSRLNGRPILQHGSILCRYIWDVYFHHPKPANVSHPEQTISREKEKKNLSRVMATCANWPFRALKN